MLRFALVLISVLAAACTNDNSEAVPETTSPGTTTTTTAEVERADGLNRAGGVDGPVVYGSPRSDGMDALLEGVLTLDRGCLYLADDLDGLGPSVLWPFGARWQTDPPAVVIGGDVLLVGEWIGLGGGGAGSDPRPSLRHLDNIEAIQQLESCGNSTFVASGEIQRIREPED